jgi:hypothetical protein
MKKLLIITLSVLIPFILIATTFNTPAFDGDLQLGTDWFVDELMDVEMYEGIPYPLYITWDMDNLYIGIDRDPLNLGRFLGDNVADISFFVAIDVNQMPGSGATSDGYGNVTFNTGNYQPEYFFAFAGGSGWAEWAIWNGNSWNWQGWSNDWGYYGWNNPGNYDDELQISWARLGFPVGIAVKAWITPETSGEVIMSYPNENPIGTNPELGWAYQFYMPHVPGPMPVAGFSPGTIEHSLPVTLSTFNATFVNNSLLLQWSTQSESNNSHWNIYRAEMENFDSSYQVNGYPIQGEGTTSEQTNYSFTDTFTSFPETTYWYWLESVDYSGESTLHGPANVTTPVFDNPETPIITEMFGLLQNYPNPFNPSTEIRFRLTENQHVELTIYDVRGRKVKTLHQGEAEANIVNSVVWYGTDESEKNVASGIYFYKLISRERTETKKMLLVK